MSKGYYTSVAVYGNKVLLRGVDENGKRYNRTDRDFRPTLFVPTQKTQIPKWTTHLGEPVESIVPGTIKDARKFIETYKDVSDFTIYGQTRFEYSFIADNFPGEIHGKRDDLLIASLDIEVASEHGFPNVKLATEEVTAITIKLNDFYHVFGCGPWTNNTGIPNLRYYHCVDEKDLLEKFLKLWSADYPDIVTGWYLRTFDIVYLVRRIANVLGQKEADKLSPWKIVKQRETMFRGKMYDCYEILGVAQLDGLQLFQKFAPDFAQESYSLDHIASVTLEGEKKTDYSEYESLHQLYKKDHQKFIDYNIQDVTLVDKIDKKRGLIDLALVLAYDAKVNFEDIYYPVRMWDTIIFNHFVETHMVLPPKKDSFKNEYEGAYVKETQTGLFNWVVSIDAKSLYPSLIMMFNMSPETLRATAEFKGVSVESLLAQQDILIGLKDKNLCLTPNGQTFDRSKKGFLPTLVEKVFNDRDRYKKIAEAAKADLETTTDPVVRKVLEAKAIRYGMLEKVKKVIANSLYGAAGNQYFRFFDVRIAAGITTAGQLAIRWIINHLNEYLNAALKTTGIDYVIASDTDSVYINMEKIVEFYYNGNIPSDKWEVIDLINVLYRKKIAPYVEKVCDELKDYLNAYEQRLIMKREVIADRGIWTGKKHYILNVYMNEGVKNAKPKIKIVGLEAVKSSTPAVCRSKIKDAINIMLNGTNDEIIEFIDAFRKEFNKLPAEAIASPRGINGLAKFRGKTQNEMFASGTPIHVRGAILYNAKLNELKLTGKYPTIKEGEKIKYLYIKQPNHFQTHVISFGNVLPDEFDLKKYIDYDTQFEKAFLDPVKDILDNMGWQVEHISSLVDFFN